MFGVINAVNDGFHLLGAHNGRQLGAMCLEENGWQFIGLIEYLAKKEGKGIGCHFCFYLTAAKGF